VGNAGENLIKKITAALPRVNNSILNNWLALQTAGELASQVASAKLA
jgi:hypothetical protein